MSFKITIVEMRKETQMVVEEGYGPKSSSTPVEKQVVVKETIYEQTVEEINVPAIVAIVNKIATKSRTGETIL